MIKEGRESANLPDVNAELLRSVEVLTERLKELESRNGSSGSNEKSWDENGCSYMSTCYTAKMGAGRCPCELRR